MNLAGCSTELHKKLKLNFEKIPIKVSLLADYFQYI
jgi:hypothetical protein